MSKNIYYENLIKKYKNHSIKYSEDDGLPSNEQMEMIGKLTPQNIETVEFASLFENSKVSRVKLK